MSRFGNVRGWLVLVAVFFVAFDLLASPLGVGIFFAWASLSWGCWTWTDGRDYWANMGVGSERGRYRTLDGETGGGLSWVHRVAVPSLPLSELAAANPPDTKKRR